jgi:hypothetical protein
MADKVPTYDDDGRRRYGPGTVPPTGIDVLIDRWIFPRRSGKYWNYSYSLGRTETVEELQSKLRIGDVETTRELLVLVERVADSATERAAAADRRATTIAGAIAISASVTLGGASLVLDTTKMQSVPAARVIFAALLLLATVTFVLSAAHALRAFVATKKWNWPNPRHIDRLSRVTSSTNSAEGQLQDMVALRAALLLRSFAGNWEMSDLKNRSVALSLRLLLVALGALVGMAVVVLVAVAAAPT